jgi:putative phage-type endonuclease
MNFTTTATKVSDAAPGSDEWLRVRRQGIGGSDVAAILGLSKWTSAYTLWAQKTGKLLDNPTSEQMEWGNRLEPVILEKFAENHPELKIEANVGTYQSNEYGFMFANPDGIYQTEGGSYGVLEIKTAMYEDEWREGVPRYYETQVQWYLQVLGLKNAYVAVLFHGNKYEEYEIQANSWEQDIAHVAAQEFMNYLYEDRVPDFDGAQSTYETVRKLHPEIDDTEVDLTDLYPDYSEAVKVAESAASRVLELKSRVLDRMQNSKHGLVDGAKVFSRQARNGGTPFLTVKNTK